MAGLLEKDIRLLWGTKQTLVICLQLQLQSHFPATEILSLDICRLW